MVKKLKKQVILITFIFILVFSQTMTSFAADEISKGNYILSMVLRSCGVCADDFIDQWRGAYESYLTSKGNQTLLNQLKAYDSLSWGANASGIEALRENVQTWLSSNTNLIENDGFGYGLFYLPVSSGSSQLPTSVDDKVVVGLSRFPENQSYSPDTHSYLFSYSQVFEENGKLLRKKVDCYIPKTNKEVIGYYNSNGLSLCTLNDSGTGVTTISFIGCFSHYGLADGKLNGNPGLFSSSFLADVNPQYLMNLPFKVFTSYYARSDYLVGGDDSKVLSKGSAPLKCYASNIGIKAATIKNQVSVNNTMKLPSSSSAAASCLSDTKKELGLKDLSSSLTAGGLTVGYFTNYTVRHARQVTDSKGNLINYYVLADTETFSDVVGTNIVIQPKSYPNFICISSLDKELSENAVYNISYDCDLTATYPYTIEYYKDNALFQSVSKTVSMFGANNPRVVNSCEDFCPEYYLPDSSSSTSLPYTVSKTDNVIKIYYQKDTSAAYPYTINYYKDGEILKTVSGTVPVFGETVISSCENLCPKYYVTDEDSSTSLPYTVSKEDNIIQIYYKKDTEAVYPYSIEHYKDGELFETVSGTVPVFGDHVIASCKSLCPRYYLIDESSSTPLPYTVSETDNLIKIYYEKNQEAKYPYIVEYYQDDKLFKTSSGTVPVFGNNTVSSYDDFCPGYYLLDEEQSTVLPYTVSDDDNIIRVYYKKDQSAKYSYTIEYYKNGEMFKSIPGTVSVFDPAVSSALSFCPSGYTQDTSSSASLPYHVAKDGDSIKFYYVDRNTVLPYRVEYYKDGIWAKTITGNISSESPLISSVPSYCPEYYLLDEDSSTTLPYTVTSTDRVIKVYYKKDESAVLEYTMEYYKDEELLNSTSGTVSVFDPYVREYDNSICPEGYVLDTSSSGTFPYKVSKDDSVIKICYIDSGEVLPYTVEYYKGDSLMKTESFNVPVSNPVVNVIWAACPEGYVMDEDSSTPLPHTITEEDNVLRVCYQPDMSNPMTAFIDMVSGTTQSALNLITKVIAFLLIPVLLLIMIQGSTRFFRSVIAGTIYKKPKVYTAPDSMFMKGVHKNTGASISDKAYMTQGNHPGSLKSKANLANRPHRSRRRNF